jgi:hypothetical protein
MWPGPQPGEPLQVPLAQLWPAGQLIPHAPQFFASSSRWAQATVPQHTPTVPSAAKHRWPFSSLVQLLSMHCPCTQRVYCAQVARQPPGGSGSKHRDW